MFYRNLVEVVDCCYVNILWRYRWTVGECWDGVGAISWKAASTN